MARDGQGRLLVVIVSGWERRYIVWAAFEFGLAEEAVKGELKSLWGSGFWVIFYGFVIGIDGVLDGSFYAGHTWSHLLIINFHFP
jgi:hypothetical protein